MDNEFGPQSEWQVTGFKRLWWDYDIVWDLETRSPIEQSPLSGNAAAFSPDGKVLALTNSGYSLNLWDLEKHNIIDTIAFWGGSTPPGGNAVAFSPNGKMLAADDGGTNVLLWDAQTLLPMGRALVGHTDTINSLAFSPDGTMLASGSQDDTVILWSFDTSDPMERTLGSKGTGEIALSPDGKTLASMDSPNIALWDTKTRRLVGELLVSKSADIGGFAFSPDGETLAMGECVKNGLNGCAQGQVTLWDIHTRQPRGQPLPGGLWFAFSPDGRILASSGTGNGVSLWSMESMRAIGQLTNKMSFPATNPSFSPDGKTLAALTCATQKSVCLPWSQDAIEFWDVQTLKPIDQPIAVGMSGVNSISFSPDGKRIISAGCGVWSSKSLCTEGELTLWNVKTHKPLGQPMRGHSSSVSSVVFSPDGKTISSGDDTIILWNAATGQQIGEALQLNGPLSWTTGLAFSPDGRFLASGIMHETAAFRGLPYGDIVLWDMDPTSWIAAACQRAGRNLTRAEWSQYFPNDEYRKTCDQWPLEPEAALTPGRSP